MSAQMSDQQALRSVLGCVGGVIALVVASVLLTTMGAWPVVGKGVVYVLYAVLTVVMVAVNALNLVALPLLYVSAFGFLVSFCLMCKGLQQDPGEGAAAWRVWLSENLDVMPVLFFMVMCAAGMIALFSYGHGGKSAMESYATVASTPRADLSDVSVDNYTNWRDLMVDNGVVSRHAMRSVCQRILAATPANSPYALTVNGKPASEVGCGWGANYLSWQEK